MFKTQRIADIVKHDTQFAIGLFPVGNGTFL